jgi:D-arabinose 1-dehydrogenase-like Zn-dependent alcohol dehydrogenase
MCYSDEIMIANGFPGISFPITVGHEIAGRIESIGPYVEGWQVGDRVAIGWYGGSDGTCDACRDGDPTNCPHLEVPGIAYPGGYADAVVVPAMALAAIPDELAAPDAGPMACAGVTVFDPLRRSQAQPGDLVAILGVGGLGHPGAGAAGSRRRQGRAGHRAERRGHVLDHQRPRPAGEGYAKMNSGQARFRMVLTTGN